MKSYLEFSFYRLDDTPALIMDVVKDLSWQPNEVCIRGELQKNNKPYEEDIVFYRTEEVVCKYIEEEIGDFLDKLLVIKSVLEKTMKFTGQLAIVVYAEGQSNPEIVMSPECIVKLNKLNACLWVDIYR